MGSKEAVSQEKEGKVQGTEDYHIPEVKGRELARRRCYIASSLWASISSSRNGTTCSWDIY